MAKRSHSPLVSRIIKLLPKYKDSIIAGMVDCSREYVRRIRCNTGIASPIVKERQKKAGKIRQLAEKGLSATSISQNLGIDVASIRSIAKENKIKIVKGKTGILIAPEKVKALREHMANGGNFSSASREIGVSYGTIFRWKKRFKIKRKYDSGWR
jgi:DNA invertase Pin-like site-specific DNA recombinase